MVPEGMAVALLKARGAWKVVPFALDWDAM